jgi:hypothetical protein
LTAVEIANLWCSVGGAVNSVPFLEDKMLRIVAQGIGWSVIDETGNLVTRGGSSGVHKTRESALSHARRVAEHGEEIRDETGDRLPSS